MINAKELLSKSKIKATNQRLEILSLLISEHGPFSVEQLEKKLKNKSCDLATIYRTISLFEDKKLLKKSLFGNLGTYYEFNHNQDSCGHHHIICKNCKAIDTFEFCVLGDLQKILEKKGFSNVSHSLEFYGLCKNCYKGIKAPSK